mmetsp:Transcript_6338/g.9327  ORF Transcript_6338/g.9327 Transcript_6338/m.9327 type:complete len:893 (-) Transcript_6338:2192-4870(-)|eukprot:CAMPEP_0194213372 /NCGR_PEP_ID=MMETSP0156-20130528/13878_1 /TAXON_ID=33649 /ORGANISM="Thalassionema nitzschioides, Strain L26-B" /LENGTH=892 /DNA_ID=CAMNT_0038941379 /DNA_START=19 /DNA_END=2697 /DNA_ORIENTATION=-
MKFPTCAIVFVLVASSQGFVPLKSQLRADIDVSRRTLAYAAPSIFSNVDDTSKWSSIDLPQVKDFTTSLTEDNIRSFIELTKEKLDLSQNSDVKESIISTMRGLSDAISTASPAGLEKLSEITSAVNAAVDLYMSTHPSLQPLYDAVKMLTPNIPGVQNEIFVLSGAIVALTVAASSISLLFSDTSSQGQAYPLGKYDAAAARNYFKSRFPDVLTRALAIATSSLGFGFSLLKDYISDDLENKADERAVELSKLLTKLGPSFIKIGQSLSIRTDLLSPAYVRGLKSLQDQVPPFDSTKAKQILEEEWGRPVDSVLSEISGEPVAAASLGQVYKATMKETGQEVAIKVLRPNIEGQIALDMHILRETAPIVKKLFNLNTDLVGIVDTWGMGFVDELDYVSEAQNAGNFMEGIQKTPLKEVVFAPPVVESLSTGKVLTTEWVVGERLDRSAQADVTVLCSIAMNAYLTMMLELGTLHSDPHPGNLLRTTDGRLCILDWGMVTRLDSDLQLTLISHMAHLTSRDYEEIPLDLLKLGFIPEEKGDMIADSGIVEVLADIYGAWTNGGGAAAVNVNKVISQLQDLTAEKGNLFRIPPYFAYIAKCFSVLEGIGLSNDEKYSIINECLPYVSKRLLTDQNERTGAALSTFIFGPDKSNIDTRLVDYERVEQLIEGFSDYTTSTSGNLLGKEDLSRTKMLEVAAEQVLDLIFCEEETPLQRIIVEQVAKIIGAQSRALWSNIKGASGVLPSGRTALGTIIDPLGLWRTSPLVAVNNMDTQTIETTQKLITLVQTQVQKSNNPMFDLSTVSREEAVELASILGRKIWERRDGVLKTGNRLATQLLKITAKKLEDGERGTIQLPPTPENHKSDQLPQRELQTSQRLQNARQMLLELEEESS